MSQNERRNQNGPGDKLRAVERFWQFRLPDTFGKLYQLQHNPFVAPCEFLPLDRIARGAGRDFGMLPQYLPFGRAVGEGGLYGFYVTPETAAGACPVLYWDEDEMYLRPVASSFDAFLNHCVLVGRYETEAQWADVDGETQEDRERADLLIRLGLSDVPACCSLPRNDTELNSHLVSLDPQDAASLCHLGCAQRSRDHHERALDFFHRASEAALWFGDPYYLVADIYRERGNYARAIEGWWSVVNCLLPLCTRTWEWDLGVDHPEADIYEVAADGLAQFGDFADSTHRSYPLWRVAVQDDPYDPDVRESLGDAFLAQSNFAEAEREYLNALALCCGERGKQPDRLYDALITLYERLGRTRDAALARHDRALPRPTV
jgi:tetratricopeptide (TPR) repeat protein